MRKQGKGENLGGGKLMLKAFWKAMWKPTTVGTS